jgi:hypothetical protein
MKPQLNLVIRTTSTALLVVFFAIGYGCSNPSDSGATASENEVASSAAPNPLRNAYFGDLHVHTKHSFDAYLFSVRGTPDDAYRYAKGEAIDHPSGYKIQLASGPLDFQGVTDHAMYLGLISAMHEEGSPYYDLPLAQRLRDAAPNGFATAIAAMGTGEMQAIDAEAVRKTAWDDIVQAAERHNDPGTFTTFIAYEYTTSTDERGNLHRNVVFRDSGAPEVPFSRVESQNPEDLWAWQDGLRSRGIDSLAIPHNSNGSNGAMFSLRSFEGEPLDADYAEQRMRNEPLVEISQVKGTSEVHPLLSPNDEWADFEIFPYRIATTLHSEEKGSYVREALGNGLAMEIAEGYNPFRFGFIGSTDTHDAGGTPEENNYVGKVGTADGTPQRRGSVPLDQPLEDGSVYAANAAFPKFGASGLAGVWAEENTRESLFNAMRRKETFGTSGPRTKVRFFAGYGYSDGLVNQTDMIEQAYAGGVPMGGDLLSQEGGEPSFLVWAMRDQASAPLQRLQIVKVWSDGSGYDEQVFDVACSDGGTVDPQTHRCPDNGATVDLSDCSFSADLGAAELSAQWRDPTFDASSRALYYVRVLENPTCRWSTWDALRAGVEPRPELPATIQERAWSSPIWYVPAGEK